MQQIESLKQALEHRAAVRAEAQAKLAQEAAERARQERIAAEKRRRTKKWRIEILNSIGFDGHSFSAGDVIEVDSALAEELMKGGHAERSTAALRIVDDEREFRSLQARQRDRLEQRRGFAMPSDYLP